MSRFASVQACHLRLESIADDTVELGDSEYRAVLEVGGVAFRLFGEREQEALLAAYAGWLNSLAYPVQVLVRVLPLDLDAYVEALEERASQDIPITLARLAHDHVTFLRQLAQQRQLLERRHYVVVPAGEASGSRRRPFRTPPNAQVQVAARRQLTARCEEVALRLRACDLTVRRLTSLELAQLWHACWRPEQARSQRLRADLLEAEILSAHSHASPERSS